MSKPSIRPGSVTVSPGAAVVPVSFTGIYFRVVAETNNGFQVSFDGEQFFPIQKGLAFGPTGDEFNQLWFKALDSALLANTITFYYGNVPIQDSRVNIIAESDLATVFFKPYPFINVPFVGPNGDNTWGHSPSDVGVSLGSIPANTATNFLPYPIFRRSIEWIWPSLAGTIGLKGLSIRNAAGKLVATIIEGVPGRLETFPTLNGNIIDAQPLTIKNDGGFDATVTINETYFLDGKYQYP